MNNRRLLMISTDRSIFDEKSDVRLRQIKYAKDFEQVHIVIFALKFIFPKKVIASQNCFIYSTNSLFKFLYPLNAYFIGKKLIEKNKINEITCQDGSFTATVGCALKEKFSIPLEIQLHGDISSPFFDRGIMGRFRLILNRRNLMKADRIRVVSNRIKSYVEDLVDELKIKPEIELRPISIDEDLILKAPIIADLKKKYKQFDRIIFMASRLEREKNIEMVLDKWPSVLKEFPRVGLIIVGKGSREGFLKNMVLEKNLEKSVIFEDWVTKDILYSYYKTADLFLNSSFFEGYGMTLVEAKSAGLKIISTDVGVAMEVGAKIINFDGSDLLEKIREVFYRL